MVRLNWQRIIGVILLIYILRWIIRSRLHKEIVFSLPDIDLSDRVLVASLWAMFLIAVVGVVKLLLHRNR